MVKFLEQDVCEPTYQPLITSWVEHGPFAMWLVQALQPKRIVELGTHYGYSYFAMCQAVKQAKLSTECFAVDTWAGDEHSGLYSEDVFDCVRAENKQYDGFSTLLRKTFDEALSDIKDGSIDLLHVDGRHFYEDVKHDFESWVPKLSKRAVVLFHDTVVQERGFGVYKYWAEISDSHPSFNFTHCHGLGVLLWGPEVPLDVQNLVPLSHAKGGPGIIESFFEAVGASATQKRLLEDKAEQIRAEQIEAAQIRAAQIAAETAAQIGEAEGNIKKLAGLLADARRRPLKQFKRLIVRQLLLALSKASPPLSKRTAKRFTRSAEKRDPNRSEIRRERSANSYENILEEWSRQRLAMSKETNDLVQRLSDGPMFSVIVPVYNTEPKLLREMINSILNQSYANWELCIADDASTDMRTQEVLRDAAKSDNRIKVVFRTENGHISNASNSAIEVANGDFLVLVDHDDLLDRDALLHVAEVIDQYPDAKIIYTDEDKIREDGTRYDPHFKPDWNRELLYSINYVSHLGCYDTQLVKKIDGFRVGFEGAQDHDLLLRCLAHVSDAQIQHIPKVLYSWRASPGSTADSADAKLYAWDAGVRAVSAALTEQHGQEIEVARGPHPFTYIPRWPNDAEPSVTIIIPTRDRLDITKLTVDSILEKTDYENYEIIIVDNGSIEPETLAWFEKISRSACVRVIRDDGPFNYSALNNKAVAQTKADIVALVNNDIEIISKGWLREMVSLASRPDVGCVGAKLYYPDNRIQHAGVIVGIGRVAGHAFKRAMRSDFGYFARLNLPQEYTVVTGACLVVRRDVYNAVGGLNEEHLAVAFNDVDLCLKIKAAGYRNLWTPLAEMYHHESASRKTDDTPEKKARFDSEFQYMIDKWQTDTFEDPAYNPNLSLDHEDFRFGAARW
ncbi:Glycosyltransferase, GT2 family [Sulfitobacter marinus]|uniref:Glycosyltransferase, GT2 family n=1 Tax=Sulfitobacter marinus TaxID=394264 RepID=A0A1I6QHL4_9RHOB|nr:glycosyltransferase [Sulfitobacter marinus]SFS51902.1 Glycosyltransferase, GT2 family [Sulfitobacter marinus]